MSLKLVYSHVEEFHLKRCIQIVCQSFNCEYLVEMFTNYDDRLKNEIGEHKYTINEKRSSRTQSSIKIYFATPTPQRQIEKKRFF